MKRNKGNSGNKKAEGISHSLIFSFSHFLILSFSQFLILLSLLSCSSDRQTFLLEGTFKGFNQGELYIYGLNGTHPLDTISVVKGQFSYEALIDEPTTFVLVFPNFSELPVFGDKGAEVRVEGDASHLKEAQITGTDDNRAMTAFRRETARQTSQEQTASAAAYIREHPASPLSVYLLSKYFLLTPRTDNSEATRLLSAIVKARPDDAMLRDLKTRLQGLHTLKDGNTLPAFTATDLQGRTVRSSDLTAPVNLITTWARWNYESTNIQRQLTFRQRRHGDKLRIVSICLDADVKECRRMTERDSVKWSTVCDGRMFETPLARQLGLSFVPDNILTDSHGKILAHGLRWIELQKKLDELL